MYSNLILLKMLTLLILINPVSTSAQTLWVDGVWYNKLKDRTIIIESDERGLFIKGIHNARRTTLFESAGNNVFMDSQKNSIIIENERTLVYKSRNGLKKFTFKLIESHEKTFKSYQKSLNTAPVPSNTTTQSPRQAPVLPLEGTWEAVELNKKVFITETRDGLKARLSDDKVWYVYFRDNTDYMRFVSEKGSTYQWMNVAEMRWVSADGERILKLIKLSDDF